MTTPTDPLTPATPPGPWGPPAWQVPAGSAPAAQGSSPAPFSGPPPVVAAGPTSGASVPREYHQALLRPGRQWWRGAVAIAVTAVVYLVGGGVLGILALAYDVQRGAQTAEGVTSSALVLTWPVLLATNLGNALLIPCAMLTQRWLFGVKGNWIHSVAGLFRWRVLARTAVIIVPLWVVYLVVMTLMQPPEGGRPIAWAFLAVVLLTTWLQSAGEEYGFRGILTRSVGSWFADRRVSLVVSALVSAIVFMLAHGAGDPWLIAYYFLFGVAMSIITWRTGGLESSALLHAVNNTVLFIVTALFEGGEATLDRSQGSGGPVLLFPIAMILVVTVGVWYRSKGIERTGVAEVIDRRPEVPAFALKAREADGGQQFPHLPQTPPAPGSQPPPPSGPQPPQPLHVPVVQPPPVPSPGSRPQQPPSAG